MAGQAGPRRPHSRRVRSPRAAASPGSMATMSVSPPIADITVDRDSGAIKVKRVVVANDCGPVVNPDGLKNQIEGNVIQSLSRTLHEEVAFDRAHLTSRDWEG